MATGTADRTLVIEREFAAPRGLVWRAWTEAGLMRRWCCPVGFTVERCEGDLKVGGAWVCAMRAPAPEGTLHTMTGVYREIAPESRLVFTHGWLDASGVIVHESLVTVVLTARGERTHMRFEQTDLASAESRDGHEGGWSGAFRNLEGLLSRESGVAANAEDASHVRQTDREITITRLLMAQREKVWRAWTDPERIGRWWGPRGFTTTTHSFDLRPGGHWKFVMHGPPPERRDYQNFITYTEVVEPSRLVYKHGGDLDCEPINFHVTVTFADVHGCTLATLCMTFQDAATKDFVEQTYGAIEGGKQTLSRLAECIERE